MKMRMLSLVQGKLSPIFDLVIALIDYTGKRAGQVMDSTKMLMIFIV